MNLKSKRLQGSFTLVEILIYIAVLVIIVLVVSAFLTWSIRSNTKARAMREVSDNARRVIEIMSYEVRGAKSIYTPTSTSTQLSLETTHYLPLGETSTYIDFFLCGDASTILCLKKESQNSIALTSDRIEVNNLEFILIATTTPSVQINLGINYKNPQNRPEYQASIELRSTVSLRSY
ncbi:MAG: prepilin-type N-terminal cleavage/methylation domain-containing protein [bacterium]|nr:prepilin-type N-terminal cleavage/methylation domain-containing protein [bacterium]